MSRTVTSRFMPKSEFRTRHFEFRDGRGGFHGLRIALGDANSLEENP
ncbi:hypothetical protein [Maliponia aquimaris]|nr:hypothetical protein [Maliponia aquimaris]